MFATVVGGDSLWFTSSPSKNSSGYPPYAGSTIRFSLDEILQDREIAKTLNYSEATRRRDEATLARMREPYEALNRRIAKTEKAGAGTLTLRGANPYTGGTTVSGGTLQVTGTIKGSLAVAAGATLDNAAASGLTFGNATLQGTVRKASLTRFTGAGDVQFDGGYPPGNSPASVTFAGDLAFGATNVLGNASLNGFSASLDQSFDLFDVRSSNGLFASATLPTLDTGLNWNTSTLVVLRRWKRN